MNFYINLNFNELYILINNIIEKTYIYSYIYFIMVRTYDFLNLSLNYCYLKLFYLPHDIIIRLLEILLPHFVS